MSVIGVTKYGGPEVLHEVDLPVEPRVTPLAVRKYAEEIAKLDRLRELAEQGQFTLRVADTYPAGGAPVSRLPGIRLLVLPPMSFPAPRRPTSRHSFTEALQ